MPCRFTIDAFIFTPCCASLFSRIRFFDFSLFALRHTILMLAYAAIISLRRLLLRHDRSLSLLLAAAITLLPHAASCC